jgi:predicted nucleic acid-binding protein
MAHVVVVDAGALIALFDDHDPHHKWAFGMFMRTLNQELVMPALTYAEVLVHPTRAGRADEFEQRIAGLKIGIRPLAPEDTTNLADLRATTSLRMPDVVVLQLVTSEQATLATTDKTLAKEARKKGLKVLQPG